MTEKYLLNKHEEILQYLLEYKSKNNDFTFSPRRNNNENRLEKGYWFQGSEKYIFVPLYKRGCAENKTKTIGLVFTEKKQFIEVVYKRVDGITESEYSLYKELENFLSSSVEISEVKNLHERKFQYIFKSNNLRNNLWFFIDKVRKKHNELLLKYQLKDKFFIDMTEVDKRLNRIDSIKKNRTLNENNFIDKVLCTTKNIILYGAPGVGKTHNYQRIISMVENGDDEKAIFNTITNNNSDESIVLGKDDFQKIKEEKRVEFVTFHQSYSYEDFIEGFRPNENGNIELKDGIFKNIVDDALKEKQKNFYLVIDEINRGNISKIFGELITLIEEDKRGIYEVALPYSKEYFSIPSNLYIIATMNSTDKSIATIDIALRRRFTFLKMKPNLALVENVDARIFMEKLNIYIKEKLGEDYMLGHSYFMGKNIDLEFIIEYKIKPLLEEYFYAEDISSDEIIKKALQS